MIDTKALCCIYKVMDSGKFGNEVKLGKNIKFDDNVQIIGKCNIGNDCIIKAGSVLKDVTLEAGCIVENSTVEESLIKTGCKIGPYCHIRPNCTLGNNVKVGSFVEIKNSKIGDGTKIPHLSYVGDADIGKNVNIGCGVVFANYNGRIKQRSTVGDNVFIGCNVNIVAPVNIASNSYICAGTTVTKDTEEGDFVIGRVRQENRKR